MNHALCVCHLEREEPATGEAIVTSEKIRAGTRSVMTVRGASFLVCPGALCPGAWNGILVPALDLENTVTVTLRCQNCGFSFIVTYPASAGGETDAIPVACGHCRSTRWSSQAS